MSLTEALHKWLSVSRWSGLTAAAKAWGMWEMATSKNRWKADDGWFAFLETKKAKFGFSENSKRNLAMIAKAAKAWGMWGMATSKNRRCVICISERKILKWNRATEKSFPKESTVRDGKHTSKNRWKADDAWFAFLRKNLIRKTIGKCFKIKCIGWYQEREDGK